MPDPYGWKGNKIQSYLGQLQSYLGLIQSYLGQIQSYLGHMQQYLGQLGTEIGTATNRNWQKQSETDRHGGKTYRHRQKPTV